MAMSVLKPVSAFSNSMNNENKLTIVYFYISVCDSCNAAEKALDEFNDVLNSSSSNVRTDIRMYNTVKENNLQLINKYFKLYNVPKIKQGTPILFIGDTYYQGEEEIRNGLRKQLSMRSIPKTKTVDLNMADKNSTEEKFSTLKGINVFISGLVNGFNPCSLSMLLFFISILLARNISVGKIGFLYCVGKFIMYFLLGTILFDVLNKLQIGWYKLLVKGISALFIVMLAGLNISDFFAAKNEKYDKIKDQLPHSLRKYDHTLIRKIAGSGNEKKIYLLSFIQAA
jgi:hypothetical protein